jgi:hypothetical protein
VSSFTPTGVLIVPPELFRFARAARQTVSDAGIAGVESDPPEARILKMVADTFTEEFQAEAGEFSPVDFALNATGMAQFLKDAVGAFENFVFEGPLNDLERIARMDGRAFLLALLAQPIDLIFGLVSIKFQNILELIEEGADLLSEIGDKVNRINLSLGGLDRLALAARNAALFTQAKPIAEGLLEQTERLIAEAQKHEDRNFTFNLPGASLPVVCATLRTLADLLSGEDVNFIDALAVINELQQDADRLIELLDEILTEILTIADIDTNLQNSTKNLASLRAAELNKLRGILQYFLDLTEQLGDASDLEKAQRSATLALEFKRMASVMCRDVKDLTSVIEDTVQANVLAAIQLAVSQIDFSPLTDVGTQLKSFISIARAHVTQDISTRFADELALTTLAINVAAAILDAVRALLGGFPSIQGPIVNLLIEAISGNGLTESLAALTGSGDFDSISISAANTQSSAGCLVDFVSDALEGITNERERADLLNIRNKLVAFERTAAAVGRDEAGRNALSLDTQASLNREIVRIEDSIVRLVNRENVRRGLAQVQ